jgi:ribosome-associated protein
VRVPQELTVPIHDDSIRLGQLLKLAGVVEDGATAREVVEQGLVTVGGEVETRRGRQVRPGDVVTLDDITLRVVSDA